MAFRASRGGLQHAQSSWRQEGGPAETPVQGVGLSAGPGDIRGIAVAYDAASNGQAPGSKIWVCDSAGQISCCMTDLS